MHGLFSVALLGGYVTICPLHTQHFNNGDYMQSTVKIFPHTCYYLSIMKNQTFFHN